MSCCSSPLPSSQHGDGLQQKPNNTLSKSSTFLKKKVSCLNSLLLLPQPISNPYIILHTASALLMRWEVSRAGKVLNFAFYYTGTPYICNSTIHVSLAPTTSNFIYFLQLSLPSRKQDFWGNYMRCLLKIFCSVQHDAK